MSNLTEREKFDRKLDIEYENACKWWRELSVEDREEILTKEKGDYLNFPNLFEKYSDEYNNKRQK